MHYSRRRAATAVASLQPLPLLLYDRSIACPSKHQVAGSSMALAPVPTIDLSAPDVVEQVRSACRDVGFFLIKNHAVDEAVISTAWDRVRAFFNEPEALKLETRMTDDYPYGYSGLETEKAGNEGGAGAYGTSDLKESWQVCLSSALAPADDLPTPQWPREPAGFREAVTAYYRAMEALSARLLDIFAAALEVPSDFFVDKCDRHWCALRALNYPEQTTPPRPGQLVRRVRSSRRVTSIAIVSRANALSAAPLPCPRSASHHIRTTACSRSCVLTMRPVASRCIAQTGRGRRS